jgi:hypothetical protein
MAIILISDSKDISFIILLKVIHIDHFAFELHWEHFLVRNEVVTSDEASLLSVSENSYREFRVIWDDCWNNWMECVNIFSNCKIIE